MRRYRRGNFVYVVESQIKPGGEWTRQGPAKRTPEEANRLATNLIKKGWPSRVRETRA